MILITGAYGFVEQKLLSNLRDATAVPVNLYARQIPYLFPLSSMGESPGWKK